MTEPSKLAVRLRDILKAPQPSTTSASPEREARLGAARLAPDDFALERVLGGKWCDGADGSCFVVERRLGAEARYGQARVGDLAAIIEDAADHASIVAGGAPLRRPFVFFDLETTGLSGGAGTYAFLVGCGSFDAGGGFVTRQHVMVRYSDERPLLATVVETLGRAGALVSFNGKSFDVPTLEMRCLFHRLDRTGMKMPHLDVLYPARRFWGGIDAGQTSCSLAALEQRVLGARRTGDVPGSEIPARYFQFVRSGDARPLAAVLEHNRLDLLSLAGLAARLLQLVSVGAALARDPREALALGRAYWRAGLEEQARKAYEKAVGAWPTHDGTSVTDVGASAAQTAASIAATRIDALRGLALVLRRARRHEEAAACWRALLDVRGCPRHIQREASEALAIHHEHRLGDLEAAKMFALRSMGSEPHPAPDDTVRHRLARIERKLEKKKMVEVLRETENGTSAPQPASASWLASPSCGSPRSVRRTSW